MNFKRKWLQPYLYVTQMRIEITWFKSNWHKRHIKSYARLHPTVKTEYFFSHGKTDRIWFLSTMIIERFMIWFIHKSWIIIIFRESPRVINAIVTGVNNVLCLLKDCLKPSQAKSFLCVDEILWQGPCRKVAKKNPSRD